MSWILSATFALNTTYRNDRERKRKGVESCDSDDYRLKFKYKFNTRLLLGAALRNVQERPNIVANKHDQTVHS